MKYYGELGLRDTFKRSKRDSLKFKLQTLKK